MHNWKFFKSARCVQVKLENGEDLAALKELDQKLWTVLAASTDGLRFDAETLKMLDADGDGRIRVPEVGGGLDGRALQEARLPLRPQGRDCARRHQRRDRRGQGAPRVVQEHPPPRRQAGRRRDHARGRDGHDGSLQRPAVQRRRRGHAEVHVRRGRLRRARDDRRVRGRRARPRRRHGRGPGEGGCVLRGRRRLSRVEGRGQGRRRDRRRHGRGLRRAAGGRGEDRRVLHAAGGPAARHQRTRPRAAAHAGRASALARQVSRVREGHGGAGARRGERRDALARRLGRRRGSARRPARRWRAWATTRSRRS